jgi:hypothetical protein
MKPEEGVVVVVVGHGCRCPEVQSKVVLAGELVFDMKLVAQADLCVSHEVGYSY